MAEPLKRWMMRLTLANRPVAGSWQARPIVPQDGALLGALMYEAYHDTIDDEGESPTAALEEVEAVLGGRHGPLISAASFLVEEQGRALGASIVTDWTDERTGRRQPLLAFLMTHPEACGRGMGTFLLSKSINALVTLGQTELVLFVTVGNEAAQHIYQKLGFTVEEEFETNRIKEN